MATTVEQLAGGVIHAKKVSLSLCCLRLRESL